MASPEITKRVSSPAKPSLPAKPDFPVPVHRLHQKKASVNMGLKPPIPPKRSSSRASDVGRKGISPREKNLLPDGATKVDVNGNHGRQKVQTGARTTVLEQEFFTPASKASKGSDVSVGHEEKGDARASHVTGDNQHIESPTGLEKRDITDRPCAKTIDEDSVLGVGLLTKPIIEVKLVKNETDGKQDRVKDRSSLHCNLLSKPTEELYPVVSDLHELSLLTDMRRGMPARSSFFAENVESENSADVPDGCGGGGGGGGIYESFGDVQTLLKHSKKEEEHTYSLPQPQCYSDSTIKAVKIITEKYDTLQRMKAHAISFRASGGTKTRSPSSPAPSTDSVEQFQLPPSTVSPDTGNIPQAELPEVSAEFEEALHLTADEMGLTKREVCRLEMFYGSHAAQVVVCRCVADLSCGQKGSRDFERWQLLGTGVPVLVLNTGLGKRPRSLFVVVADRNTGFPIWEDKITYLTNYTEKTAVFHTLCLSQNLTKMAGLKMKCPEAADMFMACFKELTSDPLDDLWKVSSSCNSRKRKKDKKKKKKVTKKTDISQPCNFYHITNLDLANERSMKLLSEITETKEAAGVAQKDRTSVIVS